MDHSNIQSVGRRSRNLYGEQHNEYDVHRGPSTDLASPRLQKKRSIVDRAEVSDFRTAGNDSQPFAVHHRINDPTEPAKGRKGSLRNAVRKIFGRRQRDVGPDHSTYVQPRISSPRQQEAALESYESEQVLPQRHASVPSPFMTAGSPRQRSPYAVEFPRSVRLKPLALGDPFSAPGSQLRRRKTLPTLQLSEPETAGVSDVTQDQTLLRNKEPETPSTKSAQGPRSVESSTVREKRRSRSMDDLRKDALRFAISPRNRKEEIKYWRESIQEDVLRASGFRRPISVAPPEEQPYTADKPQLVSQDLTSPQLDESQRSTITPQPRADMAHADLWSPSAIGTDISHDLEERMAKLEANLQHFLQHFQDELGKLTDTKRREAEHGIDRPRAQTRASQGDDGRTASMLLENLDFPIAPSVVHHNYESPAPETTALPRRPQTPIRTDQWQSGAAYQNEGRPGNADFSAGTATATSFYSANSGFASDQSRPQPQSFRSLYEMLADERIARRKLEKQLRGLQQEVMDLQYQVSNTSNIHSQRSSFVPADAMTGSTRLQALLRETGTEVSPPQAARASHPRTGQVAFQHQSLVSRFSGSDSDTGYADSDILEIAHDAH